ncbi:MAG: nitronate monooxygenase [Anaerolineales bacterium]
MSEALLIGGGKRELRLHSPILNAAGTLGFSDEAANLMDRSRLGAFVTNPVSAGPRSPANDGGAVRLESGVLLHSGLPNSGLAAVIRENRSRWRDLPCSLIVHVFDPTPQGVDRMLLRLEGEPAVDAVEVGLENQDFPHIQAFAQVIAASELPAILRLPLDCPLEGFLQAADAGAPLISMGPPRGSLHNSRRLSISGRLYGPSLFPLALRKVQQLAPLLSVPLIAAGGASNRERVDALLAAGARAVMLDTALWTHPVRLLQQPASPP